MRLDGLKGTRKNAFKSKKMIDYERQDHEDDHQQWWEYQDQQQQLAEEEVWRWEEEK